MLIKTLILGLISAGATGAVVYYGTAPNASFGSDSVQAEAKRSDVLAKKDDKIAPKAPTVKKGYITPDPAPKADAESKMAEMGGSTAEVVEVAEASVDREANAVDENLDAAPNTAETPAEKKPQTRWLDQYLKKNTAEEKSSAPKPPAEPELDEALKTPQVETPQAETPLVDMPQEPPTLRQAAAMEEEFASMDTGVDTGVDKRAEMDADEEGPRYFKIEDGKLVEVDPKEAGKVSGSEMNNPESHNPEAHDNPMNYSGDEAAQGSHMGHMGEDGMDGDSAPVAEKPSALNPAPAEIEYQFTSDITAMASDSTPMIATVMKEAAIIKKPELRDQAYFEITEFALSEGRFESARIAHDMIVQDELAYTAKSRIAVAYAQAGQASAAFNAISEVEEAELRDFMRLQVIEALIAPQNLPQGWQEK